MKHYALGVLIGLDVLANAIIGGDHYSTISCRIGLSIREGGWAAKVSWPKALRQHFIDAVFQQTV